MPDFTVVIPTRFRAAQLDRCLASLSALRYQDYEVLVVDNGGDGATAAVAASWGARYVREPLQGINRARNSGALASTTPFVAFTDDDAIVDRDWLNALALEFRRASADVVTGRILPLEPSGEGAALFHRMGAFDCGTLRREVTRETAGWFELANFGPLGRGANFALRRDLFGRWPGFDERLGVGRHLLNEEQHAMFEVLALGGTIVYTPDAIVYHPLPSSMDDLRRRHKEVLRGSTGYITLLAVERPAHWTALFTYLIAAIRRKASPGSGNLPPLLSRGIRLWWRAAGIVTYFRHVWRRPRILAAR